MNNENVMAWESNCGQDPFGGDEGYVPGEPVFDSLQVGDRITCGTGLDRIVMELGRSGHGEAAVLTNYADGISGSNCSLLLGRSDFDRVDRPWRVVVK